MDPRYQRLPNVNAAYQSNSKHTTESSALPVHGVPPNPNHVISPQKNPRKSWPWHLLSHVISLLWLAPIATLLVLNYKNHVIGASAWCPLGHCSADVLGEDAIQKAKKLDKNDHNTLGALQFVAKALEVWFMLIATSLVYDISMVFAKKGGGLPVGYFLTHLEFGDIRNLFNPLLWTSPIPHPNGYQPRRVRTFKLYLFAVLVAFLTILTNLMGPATAVLVLPTLQWLDTPHTLEQRFNQTGAASPPGFSGSIDLPGCDADALSTHNYSCTLDVFGKTLDEWATSTVATVKQAELSSGISYLSVSQERAVQFFLNTSSVDTIWVPNRQSLASLSERYIQFYNISLGLEQDSSSYKGYNNSLQTILNLQGPALGLQSKCYQGNVSKIEISKDKTAMCYSGWNYDQVSYYQKCFPSGTGWDIPNDQSGFFLGAPKSGNLTESVGVTAAVSFYSSQKAVYWNFTDDLGTGALDCRRRDKTLESCDWDKIFATPVTGPFQNSSTNIGIIEYDTLVKPTMDSRIWCDNFAYMGFPTYRLDTSPSSNPTNLIKVENITNPGPSSTPLVVDPNWLLAAWSVASNETVDGDRALAKEMSQVISSMYDLTDVDIMTPDQEKFLLFHIYSIGQALSMINYYWTDASVSNALTEDADHPIFRSWSTRHVWAFSFSGRTAKLGAVVVFAGALCVLLRIVLGIFGGAHEHTIVELFVAALEHIPHGEFLTYHTEKTMSKVRYQLRDDHGGKPTFVPERNGGFTPSGHFAISTPGAQYHAPFSPPVPGNVNPGHGPIHYISTPDLQGGYSSGSYGFGNGSGSVIR